MAGRLWSWEFLAYYLVISYAFLYLLVEGLDLSALLDDKTPGVIGLQRELGLEPGWFRKRHVDTSDPLWKDIRRSYLWNGLSWAGFLIASRAVQTFAPTYRSYFYSCTGAIYAGYVHGGDSAYLVAILFGNFVLARTAAGRRFGVAVAWTLNASALLVSGIYYHHGRGMKNESGVLTAIGAWQGTCGFMILRALSFFMDLHWATLQRSPGHTPGTPGVARLLPESSKVNGEQNVQSVAQLAKYCAYVLYPPLFLAGPVITSNSFVAQQDAVPLTITKVLQLSCYGIRFVAAAVLFEIMNHVLYFNALAKTGMWRRLHESAGIRIGIGDVALTGFWTCIFTWLKFIVVWREYSFIALLDGIEPPENVQRCCFNLLGLEDVWTEWNSSFSAWVQRYMLGSTGRPWQLANVLGAAAMSILWYHTEGASLRTIGLVLLCVMPELMYRHAGGEGLIQKLHRKWYYRHVRAALCAVNQMILAGLFLGIFVVGPEDLLDTIASILVQRPVSVLAAVLVFFSTSQVMIQMRVKEAAAGKRLCALS